MKDIIFFDIEIYPNFSLFLFKKLNKEKFFKIELNDKTSTLSKNDKNVLSSLFENSHVTGFNIKNYDLPILLMALKNYSVEDLHKVSKIIIESEGPTWLILKNLGLNFEAPKNWQTIDLMPISPALSSLKLQGARIHSKKIQDLPYDPHTNLNSDQMEKIVEYCKNDLQLTENLYFELKSRVDFRLDLTKKQNQSALMKSDVQIAESVLKEELTKRDVKCYNLNNFYRTINNLTTDKIFYSPPEFIKFETEQMQEALKIFKGYYEISESGHIAPAKKLKNLNIKIDNLKIVCGIGGLHSNEKNTYKNETETAKIVDVDVVSYYPSIILNLQLFPPHLGQGFLQTYRDLYNLRLKAKKENDKSVNTSLKIVLNGVYGKFSSKFSFLYCPKLALTISLTGQLSLLMLLEQFNKNSIEILSANTDGITVFLKNDQTELFKNICDHWSQETKFYLEETHFKKLVKKDVNNYFGVQTNGKIKTKGAFSPSNLQKNPNGEVIYNALKAFFIDNVDITDFILSCKDLKQFLFVRTVAGGGEWKGEFLGKVVRWYWSKSGEVIKYVKNGNKVALSDGATPVMELQDQFPDNIDFEKYIKEAEKFKKLFFKDNKK